MEKKISFTAKITPELAARFKQLAAHRGMTIETALNQGLLLFIALDHPLLSWPGVHLEREAKGSWLCAAPPPGLLP